MASGADGVHVGQEDMAAVKARAALGPDKIVGVSVHNVAEALAAQAAGADYLGIGAAFASHTKAEAKAPLQGDDPRRHGRCAHPPSSPSAALKRTTFCSFPAADWTVWRWFPPSLPKPT